MTTVNHSTPLILSETNEYPVYLSGLGARFNTSFGQTVESDDLIEFGLEVVVRVPAPQGDVVTEGAPVLKDGEWFQTWETRKFNADELVGQLEMAKGILLGQIEAFRVAGFEKGFPVNFGDDVFHVQIRTADRGNISDLRTLAKEALEADKPFEVPFRVYENQTVMLDAQGVVDLADAAFTQVTAGYKVVWDLKDAVRGATTVADLPTIPEELFTL